MPRTGQIASVGPDVPAEEYGYGLGPPSGVLVLRYLPRRLDGVLLPESRDDFLHQLYWVADGLLSVRRGGGIGYAGVSTAFWAHRGVVHEVHTAPEHTLYRVCLREVPPGLAGFPAGVVDLDPAAAVAIEQIARPGVPEEQGLALRKDLMAGLTPAGAVLPAGGSGNGLARRVLRELVRDPADETSLEQWAVRLHASVKSLQRDFVREFGASYTAMRTRVRLHAARVLLERHGVTETAHRVGYASASAFVAAFTREFGETPGRHARLRPVHGAAAAAVEGAAVERIGEGAVAAPGDAAGIDPVPAARQAG